MQISVTPCPAQELLHLHQLYRDEADCQLVHDSFWFRGLLDAYAIHIDRAVAGHAAVANRYGKGRLLEFYLHPKFRADAPEILREVLDETGATHIEAQSNVPFMLEVFEAFTADRLVEKNLFTDGRQTDLVAPAGASFRSKRTGAELPVFRHQVEPEGEWVIEADSEIVATGGFLNHYNPPYADLYMEVAPAHRGLGFGSYLVQEIKRVCGEAGKRPAARCDPANEASRRTLEKAGFKLCGELLVGRLK
jgi:ribosomal protein S18 acetylase RimI-like enzyme